MLNYSPVILPEKKEGFMGNIIRTVASLNLETLETAYHNVRYKLDYHLIHARLKYYSNSKNPRVIHTKLNNQRLITLRTNPHDPYLVKPGEFLTLGTSSGDYNTETLDGLLKYYYESESLDIESCPPAFCENKQIHATEPVETTRQINQKKSDKITGVGERVPFVKSSRKMESFQKQGIPVQEKQQVDLSNNWASPAASSAEPTKRGPRKVKRLLQRHAHITANKEESGEIVLDSPLESLLPRYIQSSYSSPLTFTANESREHIGKKYEFTKSSPSGKDNGSLVESESPYGQYAQYANYLQVISPVESMSIFRQNSAKHSASHSPKLSRSPGQGYQESKPDEKKVWKMVLSDISLSAARLSTGSEGTSREGFESLKGDLTHAKVKENPDYFAENMKQGKAKFYGSSYEDADGPRRGKN
ncbi:hypothetical protein JCM33374_g2140 [Metschnikowia sp. JCM 33374]|nr:hypothetical protein JCM33374_g2140 [Metschnikowia sp. JCM 33374]